VWARGLGVGLAVGCAVATAVIFISTAFAAQGADPWQTAASRVAFPIYRPTETLGFVLGSVDVEVCGDSGNTAVRARYSRSTAVFGFEEDYPQACGDAGERITVSRADINGVSALVQVFCRLGGPKCTVEDGFRNGFLLEFPAPGPKRMLMVMYSTRVALADLLKVARSLTKVTKPPPAPPPVVPASGPCSKAEATRVVRQLRLGSVGDPDVPNPVAQALCGAFVGAGSQAMVASLAIPGCGRTAGWVVFRRAGETWQLVLSRNNGADLDAVGTGIRETQFVLRPGDAHCFPTGGTRSRTWHWRGARFTASAWKQTSSGTPSGTTTGQPSGYFKTPSANIVCVYWLKPASVGCRILSGLKPAPATDRPGCPRVPDVGLKATGPAKIGGRSICPGEDEGDAGPAAFRDVARVLAYGTSWAGGGLRCKSAETGLTCRNSTGRGFFLSRESWRRF
jgi:hypothetical protein